jgi:hypothetical protein
MLSFYSFAQNPGFPNGVMVKRHSSTEKAPFSKSTIIRKACMKKITRLLPVLLGLSAINVAVVCLSSPQKAEAQITRSNWVGTWSCNNDGWPDVQVKFREHYGLIVGQIGNDAWALQQRNYNPQNDPSTGRKDHVLPLWVPSNDTEWFLAIHTRNTNYASGFSRWNGSVFGLTCKRQ